MKNENFLEFTKRKLFILILFIMFCALAGSLKGAAIESKRKVGITEQDIEYMHMLEKDDSLDIPVFIGQIPIAGEQNEFFSFKLGGICAFAGLVVGLALMKLYQIMYYTVWWQKVISVFKINNTEQKLFLNL